MEELKERMLDACLTGDEKGIREIVSSCSESVGFVFGEVDFLYLFSFILFLKLFLVFVTLFFYSYL